MLDELHETLRSLSDRIRAESSGTVADTRRRARLSEVGAVHALRCACCKYLGCGGEEPPTSGIWSRGQIRDALDASALDARELKVLRDEAEEALRQAQLAPLSSDPETKALVESLAAKELKLIADIEARESKASERAAQALKTCVADMSNVLVTCLVSAEEIYAATGDGVQCRAAAREALAQIEKAAGAWATWFVETEQRLREEETKRATALPQVDIPRALSARMVNDARLKCLVLSLRHAMKLRRRQARMVAALARLRGAVVACDAISALAGSVVVEPTSSTTSAGAAGLCAAGAHEAPRRQC